MVMKLVAAVFAAGLVFGAHAETRTTASAVSSSNGRFVTGRVYGSVASGCEVADFDEVSSYAESYHIPLVVVFGNKACSHCRKLQGEMVAGVESDLPVLFYNYFTETPQEVFSSKAFATAQNVFAEGGVWVTALFCKWTKNDGTEVSRLKSWGEVCNGSYERFEEFTSVERFAADVFDTSYIQLAHRTPESPKTTLVTVGKNEWKDLPVPTRRGYSFDGWFTEPDGGTAVEYVDYYDGDRTLYAHWTCEWKVEFGNKWYEALADDKGVTCVGWKDFYMGANIAIPVKVTDSYGESVPLQESDVSISPGTFIDYGLPYILSEREMWELYGKPVLDARDDWFGLNLDWDGGVWVYNNWEWEDIVGFTYEIEGSVWPFFDGWYDDDYVNDWLDAHSDRQWIIIPTEARPQNGTHTFTVQLGTGEVAVKFPVSFKKSRDQKASAATVLFNATGGAVSEHGRVVTLNKAIGTLPVPAERRGYTFKGWYTAKTKGEKISASTKVTKAMTVYARWSAKKYKLSIEYYEKGVRYTKNYSYAAGSKVSIEAVPKNKNMVFASWEEFVPDDYGSCDDKLIRLLDEIAGSSNPTIAFTMPPCDVHACGYFWPKQYCTSPEISLSGATDGTIPWYVEDGGEVYVDVWNGGAYCTIDTNKSIPAGLTLVRESRYADYWTLKVTNFAKLPIGARTIKLTAKNSAGKKSTVSFRVVLPNKRQAVDDGALALENLDSRDAYELEVGVKGQWDALDIYGLNGWTISAVTGIPGLVWDAKGQRMKGVPSKSGLYTATFTVMKGKTKKTATANFQIFPLPQSIVGTFYGFTCVPSWQWDDYEKDFSYVVAFGRQSQKVTVTSGSDGKVAVKIGSLTLSTTGWIIDGTGNYTTSMSKRKRNGKYLDGDDVEISINPFAGWDEDALTGSFDQWRGLYSSCPGNSCTSTWPRDVAEVFARKNATATSYNAKAMTARIAAIGPQRLDVMTKNSPFELLCPNCHPEMPVYSSVYLKTDAAGKVTLSGTIAGVKMSGTSYLSFERNRWYYSDHYSYYDGLRACARFFVDKFVIEVYFDGAEEFTELSDGGSVDGTVWKK